MKKIDIFTRLYVGNPCEFRYVIFDIILAIHLQNIIVEQYTVENFSPPTQNYQKKSFFFACLRSDFFPPQYVSHKADIT